MRILVVTDSCFLPTGQARVGREIAIGLSNRGHQVGYLGLLHRQDIFPNLPNNIQFWWTNNNFFGQDVLDGIVNQFQPDVVLTIGDFWNIGYITNPQLCQTRRYFQWCSYIPVDGEPSGGGLPPQLVPIIEDIDLPVAYTHYAYDAVMKSCMDQETRNRLRVIYHGVDTNVFKPGDSAVKRKFKEKNGLEDKFIFLTVSRNQSRKNIPNLFQAWKKFSELPEVKGKVILWPHMFFKDPMGWDIDDVIKVNDLKNGSVIYYNQIAYAKSEFHLMPEASLAQLYQVSDAFILLSGEGFGLPTFEAMASKLPCILLDHSASGELGADGRSHLVPVSGSITWTGAHLTERPIPNMDETIAAMLKVFRDRKHREEIAQKGYDFATQFTWNRVADDWNMFFLQHEVPFVKPMQMEVVV